MNAACKDQKWREKHAPPAQQQQAPDPASPDFQGLYEPR